MLSEEALLYTLALQRVPNLGAISAKKLIGVLGSAKAIFKQPKRKLQKIEGIGAYKVSGLDELKQLHSAEKELQFIKDRNLEYRYFLDSNYPARLAQCLDGPIVYFQKGNINLNQHRILSIVGTRKATSYGVSVVHSFLEELAPLNPIIVSGFAYGIDIAAQRKASELGLQTIGCLAHGFDQMYPKAHQRYVAQIERHGGFISEFWSDDPFDRTNFLKRNRIIAGLSEATLVVESAEKGGSLVTADIANSYHRTVFAVPGRTEDVQSQGCNTLIKTQQAQLVNSGADIIYQLGWDLEVSKNPGVQKKLFVTLTSEEQLIFNYLKTTRKELLDHIAIQCQIPTFKVASALLSMELKGVVRPLPGKMFEVIE